MSESKLELIAKLLAKAESTTPEEAEALTEHAERLMVKYGIEQARIDERRARQGQAREEIVQEHLVFTGAYARDIRELGAGVAHALGTVRPLFSTVASGELRLHLVGFASDVEQVKLLTASLHVQAMVAMRAWWNGMREAYAPYSESDKRRARSGFVRGFGSGAAARIRESRRQIVEEAGTGTELVLVSRKDRVDEYVDGMSLGRARRRHGADALSFVSGHSSGQQANTGGPSLTRGKALAR